MYSSDACRWEALKARNSKAQGGGRVAAGTLGWIE